MHNKSYNRWLVVLGAVIVQVCLGALYTWSVFQKPIQEAFNWSAPEVSLAFSINLAMIPFFMILAGRQLERFGPTKMVIAGASVLSTGLLIASQTSSLAMLYIGYGIFGGAGIGITYGIPIATCIKWFPDKRGMIGGLAVAGFGLGSVFYAPVAALLVENYGPFTTFFWQAVYTIIGVSIGGKLMKAPPSGYIPEGWKGLETNTGNLKTNKYDFTPKEMLRTPQYYFLLVMYTFANIAGLMIIAHASPIGQQIANLSPMQAGSIVSILAIVNTIGRIFWATLSDKTGRMRALFIMYVISAVTMFSMNSLDNFWLYALGVSLIAFCFGGAMGTFPSVAADFYGAKHVGINYGFIFLAYSAGALIGPRLAAVVVDSSGGNYQMAFLITGVLCSIGATMALFSKMPKIPES
ncbi:MAG: OFA family MFS transporter [Thermodesulfobacteriota bacterium]|nr:OFA family MFS transporter [Thermodesulfobacteriota bacterium]